MGSRLSWSLACAAVVTVSAACLQILGVDEVGYKSSDAGADGTLVPVEAGPADAPTCGDAEVACGSKCTDLQTDGQNCGRCGRECGGSACTSGACAPVLLTTLDPKSEAPHGLVVGADVVYVATYPTNGEFSRGRVLAVKKSGGQPGEIARDEGMPSYLALTSTRLYWTSWINGQLRSADLAGNTVTNVRTRGTVSGSPAPFGLAAEGTDVYVAFFARGWIAKMDGASNDADAGPLWLTAAGELNPRMVATDGAHVYWSNESVVRGAPVTAGGPGADAGSPRDLVLGMSKAWGLVARGGYLYYADNVSGEIGRIKNPTSTHEVEPLATNIKGVKMISVDDVAVYAGWGAQDRVVRVGLDASHPVTTLATGQLGPVAIGDDAKFVYWGNDADGTVWKVAKP